MGALFFHLPSPQTAGRTRDDVCETTKPSNKHLTQHVSHSSVSLSEALERQRHAQELSHLLRSNTQISAGSAPADNVSNLSLVRRSGHFAESTATTASASEKHLCVDRPKSSFVSAILQKTFAGRREKRKRAKYQKSMSFSKLDFPVVLIDGEGNKAMGSEFMFR